MKWVELLEKPQTKWQRDALIRAVTSQRQFDQLMKVFASGPYRITQRASWLLCYCVAKHPAYLAKHYATVVAWLEKEDLPDSIKRNLLRVLQFVRIPTRYQGRIAACCFTCLTGPEPVAIKVFAMTVLANLVRENPELKNELVPILDHQLPFGSAGFVSRARKVLDQLRSVQ